MVVQILSVIFLVALIVIALTNTRNFRRLEDYHAQTKTPRVSVMVPARNEEQNIAACVVSLLAQDYPDFEVIVLDDESTDRTWDILRAMAAKGTRLKIIKGKPLPEGWIGKPWACHQLVERANGELFLFTDADTRHHPETLKQAVAAFHAEEADFLTALPKEEALTLGEKLTIPIMPFGISSFLPMKTAHKSPSPLLSISVGQFMLFRREVYESIGGYQAVRHCVLDDVEMGRRIKMHGFKWRILDATKYVTCRMYTSLTEVYNGFSKNLFATFGNNILIYIPVWIWLTLVFIFPVVLLGLALSGYLIPEPMIFLAILAIVCSLVLWSITHIRFRYPLYLTFLYPASVSLWVLMAMRSMFKTIAGHNIWKGRTLDVIREIETEMEEQEEARK